MSTGEFLYFCQIFMLLILTFGSILFCGMMLQAIEDLISLDQPEGGAGGTLPWGPVTEGA
jgi:hypothetical protein